MTTTNPEMVLAFEAYSVLEKIVAKYGEDYVYPGAYTDNCMYWDYDEDAPSCLVGHYFYEMGFINRSSDALDIENNIATQAIDRLEALSRLNDSPGLEFSEATKGLLLAVQNRQDAGWSWGKSLKFGFEVATYCIDELGWTVEDIDTAIQDTLILWRERNNEPLEDV